MNFRKFNVIIGWLVFLITSIIYMMTIEPTASFWDCGEFIATAYKLEVGHPPGAPFFMILARVFSVFASPENAALAINVLSALCSSFTILFLFWTITAFAKKLALIRKDSIELSTGQIYAILGSGLVGALAYAFSDSFWFSAVEGEVYALSSLFTAVVFWAIIKWDSEVDSNPRAFRWILIIAYLMGLSIGVHLLNLLCIPAIVFIYYFKNHKFSLKGLAITVVVSLAILGFIQAGIIPGIVKMACGYEVFFTNQLGTSFNLGSVFLSILAIAFIVLLIIHSHKPSSRTKLGATIIGALLIIPILGSEYLGNSSKFWMTVLIGGATYLTYRIKSPSSLLNTGMLSFVMILIGYSTFALIVIRSSANPPMDENNPENVFTLLSYLNREQYGDRPLLYGHYWMAPLDRKNPQVDGDPVYFKSFSVKKGTRTTTTFNNLFEAEKFIADNPSENYSLLEEYIISDPKKKSVYNYDDNFAALFPRMYSSDAKHVREYKKWSNFKGVSVRGYDQQTGQTKTFKKPTAMEDIRFFVNYQFTWMYWRYFMWNFSGKQNDIQGHGGLLNGNWLSGVDFIDEQRLGSQDNLPYSMTRNKAYNKMFFLPFILGLLGLFYQLWRDYKNWLVIFLLFILTGLAIVVYLNQYPMQPRERDYAYVGSFYAFAIWIGLGVYSLFDAIKNLSWKKFTKAAIVIGGLGVFLLITDFISGDFYVSYTVLYIGFIGLGLIGVLKLIGQKNPDSPTWALISTAVCLVVPGIMLAQEWDDHNRSERRTAVDFARNYLESCEENAILFTNGDNDTFPLWYAQEVEGIRTDVRVMNLSLSNTDWYIDQMKRKAYESDPLPFSFAEEKYRQGTRDVCIVEDASKIPPELLSKVNDRHILQKAVDENGLELSEALDFVAKDNNKLVINKTPYFYIPTKRFKLPLDKEDLIAKGVIEEADTSLVKDNMTWKFPGTNLLKNNLMMLDLLANFNWERPIYYAVTTGPDAYINLDPYFELEGLAYRLTPIRHPKSPNPNMLGGVNTDKMYDNVMNKFQWGNMNSEGIYLDENNLRMTTNLRLHMANLAEELIKEEKDANAKDILDKAFEMMPESNVPFNQVVIPLIDGYYQIGEDDIANEIAELMMDIYIDDLDYYTSLDPAFSSALKSEIDLSFRGVINRLNLMTSTVYPQSDEIKERFSSKFDSAEDMYLNALAEIEEYEKQQRRVNRKSKARF